MATRPTRPGPWMFPPKSFFFPEYHRSISRPFRLAVSGWQRPEETYRELRAVLAMSAYLRVSASMTAM